MAKVLNGLMVQPREDLQQDPEATLNATFACEDIVLL
jgi:hypothetical protein